MTDRSPVGRFGSRLEEGAFRAGLRLRLQERDHLFLGEDEAENVLGETVDINEILLDLEYGLSRDWSVSVTIPYLEIDREIRAMGVHTRRSGFGDMIALLHWTPWQNGEPKTGDGWLSSTPVTSLRLDFGLSLPTGEAEPPVLDMGGTPVSLLQTGTGTFDPVLGAGLRADWGGLACTLDTGALLPFYANEYDFQAGTSLRFSGGFEIRPIDELTLRLGLNVDHLWRDIVDDEKVEPGGGWRVAIHPQIGWSPTTSINLFAGANIPLYRKADHRVLDSDVIWEFGATVTF